MKKLVVFTVVAILFSCRVFALDDAPSYTAFTMNYSYLDVHSDIVGINAAWGIAEEPMLAQGFNLGFAFQQKLYKWIVLVSGLQYQFTAAKEDGVDLSQFGVTNTGVAKFFNHNIVVPIKVGFSIPFAGKSSIAIYGGPSLNFSVSTQSEYYYNSNNYVNSDMVNGIKTAKLAGYKATAKNDEYRSMGWFDIPLGVGAILKFGRFGLRIDYEWGMVDRWKEDGKFKSDQLTAGVLFSF